MKRAEGVALPADAISARRPTLRLVPTCVPGRWSEELVTPMAEKSKNEPSVLVARSTQIDPTGSALPLIVAVCVQFCAASQISAAKVTGGAASGFPSAAPPV